MTSTNYRQIVNWIGRLAAVAGATAFYGWKIEPRLVETVHRTLPVRYLPTHLHGRTLVQLSDLHVGGPLPNSHFIKTLKRVGELDADFVVYTGDFIAFKEREKLYNLHEVLAHSPKGRLGTAAVLGNHDYGRGWSNVQMGDLVTDALEAAGISVLRNEVQEFAGLHIAGLEEIWSPNHKPLTLMGQLDPMQATILLCHNPEILDRPIWSNYQGWVLSGHTHGGQVKLPYTRPFFLPMDNKLFVAGEFQIPTGQSVYVSRGLGHSFPFRFCSRPEITIHTLVPVD